MCYTVGACPLPILYKYQYVYVKLIFLIYLSSLPPRNSWSIFRSLLMYNMGPKVAQHLGCRLFCQKFYFCFRFEGLINKRNYMSHTKKQFQYLIEGYLTKFQCTVIERRAIEIIEKSNSTYITKLGWPTSRLNSTGKSLINSNLESQLGTGPRRCIHPMSETSNCSLGGSYI